MLIFYQGLFTQTMSVNNVKSADGDETFRCMTFFKIWFLICFYRQNICRCNQNEEVFVCFWSSTFCLLVVGGV